MLRWIFLLTTAIMLSGCVTTREVVYREPYTTDSYGNAPTYYRDGGSYYSPAYSGQGDYYFGTNVGSGFGISYFDYPVYYSIFWPVNRWYYDPFVHPGYYYGVTWFPRSYLSLGLSYGSRWSSHGWMSYSPYRYAWVDNYYDWRPWYDRYPNYRRHYPTPRYGDARVEASRLADLRRPVSPRSRPYDQRNYGGINTAPSYRGNRAADYGSARDGVRRVGAGASQNTPRSVPRVDPVRGTPGGSRMDGFPRGQTPGAPGNRRGEIERLSGQRAPASRGVTPPGDRQFQDHRAPNTLETRPVTRPRAPDSGIPVRRVQPAPVREPASSMPLPSRSVPIRGAAPSRPVVREVPPVRSTPPIRESMPVRDIAPIRQNLPVRSATPQPHPIPSHTPAAPAPVVRSAPNRTVTPPSAPASRPVPVESRSEGSSSRGSSSEVRRVGSNRIR
ncbi:hypothetical protein OS176_00605 [Xanthomonadaceae bacterium XH05]|nr:hypothetical protein [Xanthomonadaceae bacterium XH05]